MFQSIKRVIKLWHHREDTWEVEYFRKWLEKEAIQEGQIINTFWGGAFIPMKMFKFQYLGRYKGKKIFKEVKQ